MFLKIVDNLDSRFRGNDRWGVGIFFGFFALYLHTCGPSIVPYRDVGEMASLLKTFGVAHPPGYPLYTLLGRCFIWLPLGNIGYRANVFSALCAAMALAVLFFVLRSRLNSCSSCVAVLAFGFSNPFWELANVSEMYALGVLWVTLLLLSVFVLENIYLFAFLMTLGLGIRMDMMLLIPIFLFWFWKKKKIAGFPNFLLFSSLGLSVFLYLMIRSLQNPLIDWGNPDNFSALFNSLSRKSYGGTLDLLSLSYQWGENFPDNIALYAKHFQLFFGWVGVGMMLLGGWGVFQSDRTLGIILLLLFFVAGRLFFFFFFISPPPPSLAAVFSVRFFSGLLLVGFFWVLSV